MQVSKVPIIHQIIPEALNKAPLLKIILKNRHKYQHDFVEITGAAFTKTELALMNECREFGKRTGLETTRIIDINDKQIKGLKLIELPYETKIDFKKLGIKKVLTLYTSQDSTSIHNHNYELPISFPDIIEVIFPNQVPKLRKSIATTPSGGFSCFEKPFNKNILFVKEMGADLKKGYDSSVAAGKELGLFKIENNKPIYMLEEAGNKKIKTFSDYAVNLIEQFADKYEFKFNYKLNN